MYSEEIREDILNLVAQHFSQQENVRAIALIGSLASGKYDLYSDIDLALIIDDNSVERLWINAERFFEEKIPFFKLFKQIYNNKQLMVGVFLESGLEINVNFCCQAAFEETIARQPKFKFKIIYSREDFALNSKESVQENFFEQLLTHRINDMWFDFRSAMVALKRNKLFAALKGIEQIRDQIIEIYAKSIGLEERRYKEVDDLNDMLKNKFSQAHCSEISYTELRRSLLSHLILFAEALMLFGRKEEGEEYLNIFRKLAVDMNL